MKNPNSVSQNNGKIRQFIIAVVLNCASITLGVYAGWPSPTIPQLRSNHPPVGDTPFNEDQISWIASLPFISGSLTVPLCGRISERIGRKYFAILTGFGHIVTNLLTIFAQNYVYLYAARVGVGVVSAMTFSIVPLYIGEFASTEIRGLLGSLVLFELNIGVLFAYVTGAYTSYIVFNSLCLIFPVIFVVAMLFVPETPVFLVRRNCQLEAHKSLMFFRGNNRALVERELAELQFQAKISDSSRKTVSVREFFGDRANRKGLVISMGLIAAQRLSGITAVTMYSQTIFNLSGSSVPPEVSPIIIALLQIAGSQMSTMLMERAGRRLLSLISSLGMAASYSAVTLFFYLQRNGHDVSAISWLPLVGLSAFIVTYCLGIGPVPYVVVAEVFRLHVTSFASGVCFVFYFAIGFVSIRSFDLAMKVRGSDGGFFMYAVFCLVSFVFCYCLLPETKGREREDIVEELGGARRVRGDEARGEETAREKCTEVKLLAKTERV